MSTNDFRPVVFDRTSLLYDPTFWAIHFYHHQICEDVEAFFGVSDAAFTAFEQRRLSQAIGPDEFPCYRFTLPLIGGHSCLVEYEFYPEDYGLNLYVSLPDWDEPLLLCRNPSAYDDSPLRWAEALAISRSVRDHDPVLSSAALPLLWPTVITVSTDADRSAAGKVLRDAWQTLGAVREDRVDDLIAQMLDQVIQTDAWTKDRQLGWINSKCSLRNPEHSSPEFILKVKQFFEAIEREGSP